MRRIRKLIALAGVVCVFASGLTACGESKSIDEIPDAYVDLFDRLLDSDYISDLQRGILEDYDITDAEMQEAKDRFLSCVADKGYTGVFFIRGSHYSARLSDEDHQKLEAEYQDDPDAGMTKESGIVRTCSATTVDGVAEIYAKMKANPENKSFAELARECLEKIGVADDASGVTDANLHDAIADGTLGTDARNHCLWGAYVDKPMWVTE